MRSLVGAAFIMGTAMVCTLPVGFMYVTAMVIEAMAVSPPVGALLWGGANFAMIWWLTAMLKPDI